MPKVAQLMQDIETLKGELSTCEDNAKKIELSTQIDVLKAKLEIAQEYEQEKKKNVHGGIKMNKQAMKNKIFRAMMKGQEFTEEMKSSGIALPVMFSKSPDTGNIENAGNRGGYLVPEEFLDVDEYGGEVVRIPATDINITEPSGKAPYFDRDQAKQAGKFMATTEELTEITETHPVFGQLQYTAVDKYGIVPVSLQLIDDANYDVVAAAGECFGIAAAAQRNLDIMAQVNAISGIATKYAGTGKTFEDIEGAKAIQKAILSLHGTNRANATIVVSSDVWAKLASLADKNDNPILMRDVNNAAMYRLYGVPVIELEDSTDGYCFVGNFARVAYFTRKALEISMDYSAGFTRNAVLVKGGMRGVAMVREPGAFVKVCEGASA